MKYSLFFISIIYCLGISAQLLDNSKGTAFTDAPYFNTQFVKRSKIKEIQGEYIFKKQGDVMRESKYVYVFNFDEAGNLILHYQTAKGDLVTDTTVRFYTYSPAGDLTSARISEKSGFLTTYYTYNDNHQSIKEEVYRDIDTLHSFLKPQIERSLLWNTETMKYEVYEGQHKRKVYNSYGNQYFEETVLYDSLGLLASKDELFTITRNKLTTKYTYSDRGYLEKMVTTKNVDTIPLEEVVFTYDNFGNIASKKVYKKGVFTTEYQVIYSGKSGLLSSILIREVSTNFISIIRFKEPKFWD